MKSIICSVVNENCVKKYELTYEEEVVNNFFERLKKTEILPVNSSDDMFRVYDKIWLAEKFDLVNKLHTSQDIKQYIQGLHESSIIDLTELYILMKSNGKMRNQQVRSMVKEFLNLYTYREVFCCDVCSLSQVIRKMYELGVDEDFKNIDSELVRINTEALKEIGFSIEAKVEKQNEERKRQKVIKR